MPGNRKSTRLKHFDYSREGSYFVTICVNDRKCVFGDVHNGEMVLNDAGKMVEKWWRKLREKYDGVEIDQYCVMPNHLYGIIDIVGKHGTDGIVGAHLCVRPDNNVLNVNVGAHQCVRPCNDDFNVKVLGQTHRSAPTLGTIIQWFKTMSTNEYMRNVKTNHWSSFNKYFWQRNYYDRIIRSESDLMRIREYIINNPMLWADDDYYSSLGVDTC